MIYEELSSLQHSRFCQFIFLATSDVIHRNIGGPKHTICSFTIGIYFNDRGYVYMTSGK